MSSAQWNAFRFFVICFGLIGTALMGCTGKKSDSEANQADAAATSTPVRVTLSDRVATSIVAPSELKAETSPAAIQPPTVDESDPKQVCLRFLELLQSGNRIAAENLLTKSALLVTGKADLVLQPLGGPSSRFEIGEPNYATIKNEVAYVDCKIIESEAVSGEHFTVTWLLKKQNSVWRISGLLDSESQESRTKLLSFENPNDVEEIKRRASESSESETSFR